jgi:glutaredoxin
MTEGTSPDEPPPPPARVTVLTRPGCHLCEAAVATVAAVCAETSNAFVERDISADVALTRQYGEQIPVTLVDGAQHDFWWVDADRLRRALMRPPASS